MQRNLYSTCFQKAPLESVRACTMHKSEGDQQGLECVLELSTRGPAAIPLQFDSLSSSRAQYMRFSHRTEVHAAWSVNLPLSCILYFCNLYFCIWVILHFVFWQSRTSARQIFPRKARGVPCDSFLPLPRSNCAQNNPGTDLHLIFFRPEFSLAICFYALFSISSIYCAIVGIEFKNRTKLHKKRNTWIQTTWSIFTAYF